MRLQRSFDLVRKLNSFMGVVLLPSLLVLYGLGYSYKDSEGGVPIPGFGKVDIWRFLVKNEPQNTREIAMENFAIWSFVYSLAHFLMYVKPQRSLFHPFKLNPNYPPGSLIMKEIFRSMRGVTICTFYEIIMNNLHSSGVMNSSLTIFYNEENGSSFLSYVFGTILLYVWADAHFYWTHRLLHTQWFYKKVHKVHHESYNPDPFSGLSMHWFESAVYFSAAPLINLIVPLHMFRTLSIGLILFPLEGHWGFGNWEKEASVNHYIHHSKFNWNYGSSPMWDHLMGTNYPKQGVSKNDKRELAAQEQAQLVKCQMGKNYKDVSRTKAA